MPGITLKSHLLKHLILLIDLTFLRVLSPCKTVPSVMKIYSYRDLARKCNEITTLVTPEKVEYVCIFEKACQLNDEQILNWCMRLLFLKIKLLARKYFSSLSIAAQVKTVSNVNASLQFCR